MRIAFIIDPLHGIVARKDSTVELMRTAQQAGDELVVLYREGLSLYGDRLLISGDTARTRDDDSNWLSLTDKFTGSAEQLDMIFMRLEPPVDDGFRTCCALLAHAELAGVPVFNKPSSLVLRDEKLACLSHPRHIPRTMVSADLGVLREFASTLAGGYVVKPLGGMGGQGVFSFRPGDSNFVVALEVLGAGKRTLLVQEKLSAIAEGDRRVFVIGGKPAEVMLNRLPAAGSHRGNMAAGGKPVAMPLGDAEREVADAVAPDIAAAGIIFAGLDIIGGRLTEINITCPTGLRQVRDQLGVNLAAQVLDAAKKAAQERG